MANVLIIGNAASDGDALEDVLDATTGFGHTVTKTTATLVDGTPTLLEGRDAIIVLAITNGSAANESENLASLIVDLFLGNAPHGAPETPGVLVCHPNTSGYSTGDVVTNSVAVELGIIGAEKRDTRATGDYPADAVDLAGGWRDHPVTMGFGLGVLGPDETGAATPASTSPTGSDVDPLVGASGSYGAIITGTLNTLTHVPTEVIPHAGDVILRADRKTGTGLPCGVAVRSGTALQGKRPTITSSEADLIWIGAFNAVATEYGAFGAQLLNMCVKWLAGELTETYVTGVGNFSLVMGIDLDGLGSLVTSSISWTETLPSGTTVAVGTSVVELGVASAFGAVTNGGPVNGLSASDPLANVQVLVKIIVQTSNPANTPLVTDLKITIEGDAATITASPIDYFTGGLLTWDTGDNEGSSVEVKQYDPSTQRLTFAVPVKKTIQACDEFTVLPGCDKTRDTCRDRFDNIENFRGQPDVPGKDRLVEYPDSN